MTWEGQSAARAALDAIRARLIAAAPDVVRDGSLLLQAQQRENATHRPGPLVRTGALWRGIVTSPVVQTGAFSWTGGTRATVIYSRIQERGGHIYPRRARTLAWTDGPRPSTPEGWRQAAREGRAHYAMHVYLPPRPYFAPGIVETAPKYEALAAERFGAAIVG